jgi:CO/xanthine dehydrogenase Mo-binding subunit
MSEEPTEDLILRALFRAKGNITKAAEALGVESVELRRMVIKSPPLERAMDEIMEQSVDRAIEIMRDGLDEESYLVRFYAAKEFLRTEAGRRRGFGMPREAVAIDSGGGGRAAVIVLKWLGDDEPEPKRIEGP